MAFRRAQVATEYLIILSVVVSIALIVVSVLGQFIDFFGGIDEKQSRLYWGTQEISITFWRVFSDGNAEIVVKNNLVNDIKITDVIVNGEYMVSGAEIYIPVAAETKITGQIEPGTGEYELNFDFIYEIVLE